MIRWNGTSSEFRNAVIRAVEGLVGEGTFAEVRLEVALDEYNMVRDISPDRIENVEFIVTSGEDEREMIPAFLPLADEQGLPVQHLESRALPELGAAYGDIDFYLEQRKVNDFRAIEKNSNTLQDTAKKEKAEKKPHDYKQQKQLKSLQNRLKATKC